MLLRQPGVRRRRRVEDLPDRLVLVRLVEPLGEIDRHHGEVLSVTGAGPTPAPAFPRAPVLTRQARAAPTSLITSARRAALSGSRSLSVALSRVIRADDEGADRHAARPDARGDPAARRQPVDRRRQRRRHPNPRAAEGAVRRRVSARVALGADPARRRRAPGRADGDRGDPERAHRRGGAPRGARRRPRDSPAPASTRRPRRADRDDRGPQRDRRAASSVPPAAVRGRLRGPVPPAGAGELRPLGRTHERRGDGGRPASDPHTPAPAANSTPSHGCPPIRSRSSPISTTGGS